MRWIAILVAVTVSGCAEVPSYLVAPEQLHAAVAPATREGSSLPIHLRGGSFMPTHDPPLPDGRVRVRGPGRHSTMWKAGLGLTVISGAMLFSGAALAVAGAGSPICGSLSSLGSCPVSGRGNYDEFVVGLVIGPIGAVLTLVAPALMIAGARLEPVVVRAP